VGLIADPNPLVDRVPAFFDSAEVRKRERFAVQIAGLVGFAAGGMTDDQLSLFGAFQRSLEPARPALNLGEES
jgi:hypothetical protein